MIKWWTLYVKEIKDSMAIFSLMITVVLCVELYAIWHAGQAGAMILSVLPLLFLIVVLPMVMFYLYGREWKSDTRYFLLVLPVPRYMIGLIKYLSVISIGLVLLVICLIGIYWNFHSFSKSEIVQNLSFRLSNDMSQSMSLDSMLGGPSDLWGGGLAIYLVTLYFLLSFSVVVQSVNLVIHRFTVIVTIVSGLLGWTIYFQLGQFIVSDLGIPYIMETLPSSFSNESFLSLLGLGWFIYTLLVGLLFLLGGLFLTEKYLEA